MEFLQILKMNLTLEILQFLVTGNNHYSTASYDSSIPEHIYRTANINKVLSKTINTSNIFYRLI